MGYYTYYTLHTNSTDAKEKEIALWMVDNLDYFNHTDRAYVERSNYPLEAVISSDSMKWYDHQDDMKRVAAAFPDVKFELYGEGEDREDTWVEYYWNTRFDTATARIVWDEPPYWMHEEGEGEYYVR